MNGIGQLAALIVRHGPREGMAGTALRRLQLIRADGPTMPVPSVYEASLCLIAQGSKCVSLADRSVTYDAARYLLVSLDLPLVGRILEASPEAPYLCAKIDIDHAALVELIVAEGGAAPEQASEGCPAALRPEPAANQGARRVKRRPANANPPSGDLPTLAVYPSDPDLVDAVCRLVRLLDRPAGIPALAPLVEREILYRLLTGPHGPALRQMAVVDSRLSQVGRAIARIRDRVFERLRIDEIAAAAGMSPSSLHAHFKSVTRMTPLEYQKQLRLQEARRLMLADGMSAGAAGFSVGYDSQSQFSREYHRLFGAPPRRDIERLQTSSSYAGDV